MGNLIAFACLIPWSVNGSPPTHFAQLRALWITAGGSLKDADTMAAIAAAESRGRLAVHNERDPYGGSWCARQINGVHPFFLQVLTHDPYYCALAAVYVRHRQALNAWSTHSDGQYRVVQPRKSIADFAPVEARSNIAMWFVLAAAFFALWRLEAASENWEKQ